MSPLSNKIIAMSRRELDTRTVFLHTVMPYLGANCGLISCNLLPSNIVRGCGCNLYKTNCSRISHVYTLSAQYRMLHLLATTNKQNKSSMIFMAVGDLL